MPVEMQFFGANKENRAARYYHLLSEYSLLHFSLIFGAYEQTRCDLLCLSSGWFIQGLGVALSSTFGPTLGFMLVMALGSSISLTLGFILGTALGSAFVPALGFMLGAVLNSAFGPALGLCWAQ